MEHICPRCGATIPEDARWEPFGAVAGRQALYRYRHERPGRPPRKDRRKCVVYAGPAAAEKGGAGEDSPARTA
jgi:hypothetical protein